MPATFVFVLLFSFLTVMPKLSMAADATDDLFAKLRNREFQAAVQILETKSDQIQWTRLIDIEGRPANLLLATLMPSPNDRSMRKQDQRAVFDKLIAVYPDLLKQNFGKMDTTTFGQLLVLYARAGGTEKPEKSEVVHYLKRMATAGASLTPSSKAAQVTAPGIWIRPAVPVLMIEKGNIEGIKLLLEMGLKPDHLFDTEEIRPTGKILEIQTTLWARLWGYLHGSVAGQKIPNIEAFEGAMGLCIQKGIDPNSAFEIFPESEFYSNLLGTAATFAEILKLDPKRTKIATQVAERVFKSWMGSTRGLINRISWTMSRDPITLQLEELHMSPLAIALGHGKKDAFRYFVGLGAEVESRELVSHSPLANAVGVRDRGLISEVIKAGGRPDATLCGTGDCNHRTPIHVVAFANLDQQGFKEYITWLMSLGFDPRAGGPESDLRAAFQANLFALQQDDILIPKGGAIAKHIAALQATIEWLNSAEFETLYNSSNMKYARATLAEPEADAMAQAVSFANALTDRMRVRCEEALRRLVPRPKKME